MEKRIRIKTTPLGEDKYLNIDLKQSFDTLDILSLEIKKEDFYRSFEASYGVLIGRININNGLGVGNAKVSIFVPLDEEGLENPMITSLYPYVEVNDKNGKGYRYNLLTPKKDYKVGSFPTKVEFIKDEVMGGIYKKYYKYTTVTNSSEDFMIFGAPVGSHTLHVDIDLSDMTNNSFTANELRNSGVPNSGFVMGNDGKYSLKVDPNLESLPQIISQNITVDIRPLWGDVNEEMVGITRCDTNFNINYSTYATFVATMGFERLQFLEDKGINFLFWKDKDFAEMFWYNNTKNGRSDEKPYTPGYDTRILPFIGDSLNQPVGDIRVKVYMYDDNNNKIEMVEYNREESNNLINDGFLILKLPCYSHKIITDELGNTVYSTDGSGLPSAGTYHIEVLTDDGYVMTGGQFYGYMIKNNQQKDEKKGFLMERGRIYTCSFRHRMNKKEVFGMKRSTITTTNMLIGNFSKNHIVVAGSKQLPFSFEDGDWLNGFLYFGRMANGGDKANQSAPVDMQYNSESRIFYNVETRVVDITDIVEKVSKSNEYYHFFRNTNDFKVGKIEQPKETLPATDSNLLPKPLKRDRGQGQYMLMTGMYLSNTNNFKKYYNIIIK